MFTNPFERFNNLQAFFFKTFGSFFGSSSFDSCCRSYLVSNSLKFLAAQVGFNIITLQGQKKNNSLYH